MSPEKKELSQKIIKESYQLAEEMRKCNSFFTRIEYPSTQKNGSYELEMVLKDVNLVNCQSICSLGDKIKRSKGRVPLDVYSVFGKQDGAHRCPNCLDSKVELFNMWDMMQGILYPLLIDLHASINLGVLYDSKNELPIEKSFSELLTTCTSSESEKFIFKVISGAREVKFNISLDTKRDVTEIVIIGETYDLGTDKTSINLKAKR